MKNKFFVLCSLIFMIGSNAAYCQNDTDSVANELNLMNNKNSKKYPSVYFSLSYIGWQGLPSNVKFEPNNNREVGVSKMFNLLKNKKHLNFALGFAASVANMHNNVQKWQFDSSGMLNPKNIIPDTLDNHKLTLSYIYIPFELKYRFGNLDKKQPYIIGLGAKVGSLLYASERTKDADIKIRKRLRDGISKINYGAYAYFGYKFVGIIAGYNFSPMFDSEHSPTVTNWTAGLTLMF